MLTTLPVHKDVQATPDRSPHAVVIGSGFGGLAAAVRLGARGYRVTVLERLDAPGGRAYVFRQDGFTFDAGPTIVTAPFLFEELWQLCGRSLADDVELRPVSPFYQVHFHDGEVFHYSGDPAAMRAEIARFSPADVAGYERFMAASEAIFTVGFEQLGHVPFGSWTDMARIVPKMVQLASYRTVYGLVSKYVKDERLRVVLSFHPLLVGGNPFRVTSIYSLIAFLERRWGVYFAMGGTGRLVQGLVKLIERQGGSVTCGQEVSAITLKDGTATGVRLASGAEIPADIVVSNADAAWTYRYLLPPEARRRWSDRRIGRARYSMSLFVWYFGTKRRYDDVAHHTILLGPRYRALLKDIFDRKVVAPDFSLYLHRPTATDPSHGPRAGCDSLLRALAGPPPRQPNVDWRDRRPRAYRQRHRPAYLGRDGHAAGLSKARSPPAGCITPHRTSEDRLLNSVKRRRPSASSPCSPRAPGSGRTTEAKTSSASISWVRERTPGRACPASCHPPESSTEWYRMPQPLLELNHATPSDFAACRQSLRFGSRTFFMASWLLPRQVRDSATALYAFCRLADDAVDLHGGRADTLRVLRERLARAYEGGPLAHPVDRAFADVVGSCAIPRALPEALLEGIEWDARGYRYEDFPALCSYAARVAGTVGAMMAIVMGARGAESIARACDLGAAMQLSNIARDVGEDARAGRLYLPLSWLREAGIDPDAWLAAPAFGEDLALVVRRLLRAANRLYGRAEAGIGLLPMACRPAIYASRLLYAEIGREVERAGFDSVSSRAVVGTGRKAWLLGRALNFSALHVPAEIMPTLAEARFLVEAVAAAPAPRQQARASGKASTIRWPG